MPKICAGKCISMPEKWTCQCCVLGQFTSLNYLKHIFGINVLQFPCSSCWNFSLVDLLFSYNNLFVPWVIFFLQTHFSFQIAETDWSDRRIDWWFINAHISHFPCACWSLFRQEDVTLTCTFKACVLQRDGVGADIESSGLRRMEMRSR